MLERGLATVINYRQDDEQRSPEYDKLRAAQEQAIKGQKGMHAKKQTPSHRINDLTTDHSRIKHHYLPSWQRALRTEALVEFVASGSRLRLYCPKESCLVTFLLAGISCRRRRNWRTVKVFPVACFFSSSLSHLFHGGIYLLLRVPYVSETR